jgi:two-component system, OmpR family, phosphate regulon sensor histidine kinase PhoR
VRLAQRLLLHSLVIVSVLVLCIVTIIDQRLETRITRELRDELAREARLIGTQWTGDLDADTFADSTGRALQHRVTLIDSTGVVRGDTDFDGDALSRLDNHATRPEVIAAKRDGTGFSRRTSPSQNEEELYVAVRAPLGIARISLGTRALDEIFGGARRDVLAAGVIAILIAVLVAYFFARSITRPVLELRSVTRALADGDLQQRPSVTAPGEIGELADSVNRLAEQLASRLSALRAEEALNAALIEALTEGVVALDAAHRVVQINESGRKLLGIEDPPPFSIDLLPRERVLRDALGEAIRGKSVAATETTVNGRTVLASARPLGGGGAVLTLLDLTPVRKLETVRRDFVANVSHELRTPLTIVSGFAETLAQDDGLSTTERTQFAETILTNMRRMQRLVDDLLDLSRIESGGWRPRPVELDVATVAEESVAAVRDIAQGKGVELTVRIHPEAARVFADRTAILQILSNLLENAVRHTMRGTITVFTEPSDKGGSWIGVRDTGNGIAPEHLARIFERFYRADVGRDRESGGTGLGLAIVKHLTEAHGGRVRAESTPGKGTMIASHFPAASEAS